MSIMDLAPVGLEGYKIDKDGVVYGKSGKPLQFLYTGRGYRAVPICKTSKRPAKIIRIDKLLGAAFHNIELGDDDVQPVYRDGDFNNVSLDNINYVRK